MRIQVYIHFRVTQNNDIRGVNLSNIFGPTDLGRWSFRVGWVGESSDHRVHDVTGLCYDNFQVTQNNDIQGVIVSKIFGPTDSDSALNS